MARGANGKVIFLSKRETEQHGNGLFRFGVPLDVAPLTWPEIREQSGMAPRIAQALVDSAKAAGADPRQWRGTFDDVPLDKCVAIDFWYQGKWIDAVENQDKFLDMSAKASD